MVGFFIWLWLGVLVSIAARLLPTFFPAANALFKTAPFPLEWWPIILVCLLPGFIGLEVDKLIRRKFGKGTEKF